MTISRRQFVGGIAGAGVASMASPHPVLAQSSEPIRVGLLAAKTGPLASGGIDMDIALTMFLKERDNTLAGRKVELIVADTAGVPATARTKAQELIEKEQRSLPDRTACRLRSARNRRLHYREGNAYAWCRRRRRHDAASSKPLVRAGDLDLRAICLPTCRLCFEGAEVQENRHDRRRLCVWTRNVRRLPARFRRRRRQDHSKDLHTARDARLRQLRRAGQRRRCDLPWHRRLERIPLPAPIHRIRPQGQDGRDWRHDGARRIRASQHGRRSLGDSDDELVLRRARQSPEQGVRGRPSASRPNTIPVSTLPPLTFPARCSRRH